MIRRVNPALAPAISQRQPPSLAVPVQDRPAGGRPIHPAGRVSTTCRVLTRARRLGCGAAALGLLGALLTGCAPKSTGDFQGYIEGEFVYAGAPLGGTLEERPVERGQSVKPGDLLFVLERGSEKAAVEEADQKLAQAAARLENLRKGKRPSELAALQARWEQATVNTAFWDEEFTRRQQLFGERVISANELDQVKSQRDASRALAASLAADLETARLGGREDEIHAAEAEVETAKAAVARARWALDQKTQKCPVAGVVQDTLYRVGEYVPAGNPVVCLLPPENIKVRFFVPEPQLARVHAGQPVQVKLDGRAAPLTATVNYLSTQAEFTPPVIYSRETRAKLVFMVEAKFAPETARELRPGQPADVRLGP